MPEELIDYGTFEISLPVWTVIDSKRHKSLGLLPSILPMACPEVGRFFVLCTDLDLVQKFIETFVPASGRLPAKLTNSQELFEILTKLEAEGWKHVGVDVSLVAGTIRGKFYPISVIIKAAQAE